MGEIGTLPIKLAALEGDIAAKKQKGDIERQQHELNAQFAELDAEDSIRRGEKKVQQQRSKTKQLIGKQRAALAAQGIQVDTDTAAEVQAQTAEISEEDVTTIRRNARREALGFKSEAIDARFSGRMSQIEGKAAAHNTLVTGGLDIISSATSAGSGLIGGK